MVDIDQRVEIVNMRLDVVRELLEILRVELAEQHGTRLEVRICINMFTHAPLAGSHPSSHVFFAVGGGVAYCGGGVPRPFGTGVAGADGLVADSIIWRNLLYFSFVSRDCKLPAHNECDLEAKH